MVTKTNAFPLEELIALPIFMLPRVSEDGTQVAYYTDRSGEMELWVQDIRSGDARQISHGQLPKALHAGFTWDRAGQTIAFPRDEGGDEQHNIWVLDVGSGEAQQLTENTAQEIPIEFSPDDVWISFLSTRHGQMNLFVMRRDGTDIRQLTHFKNPVFNAVWSPTGRQLAITVNDTDDLKNTDVYLLPVEGGEPRLVYSSGQGTQDSVEAWSPDGRSLLITSDSSGVERPGILHLDDDRMRLFGEDGVEETGCSISADGRSLLTIRNQNATRLPVVYDIASGEGTPLPLPPGSVDFGTDAAFALGGQEVVIRYSTSNTRPSLFAHDLTTGKTRMLLEAEYGSIDPSLFSAAEDVRYESFDGLTIHALLYRPHGLQQGERRPAVVVPHGGPTAQYAHRFDVYMQFLANEGYVVLAPNIRGSTGYGVGFRDMARLDWGGADLQDVVAGRDYLAAQSYVDSQRIAIFGGSYGGFMTFIAMTKAPDKWKAGAALVGISDLFAMYEESMPHFKYFLEEQMGKPDENRDLWTDRSAVNFAHNMQAKLLIAHGVNDPRCPIGQARIFRDRLLEFGRTEGKDLEYVEFAEEGHGSTDRGQRLRMLQVVGEFLERSL